MNIKVEFLLNLQQFDELIDILEKKKCSKESAEKIEKFLEYYFSSCFYPLCIFNILYLFICLAHPNMKLHLDFIRWVKDKGADLRKTKMAIYGPDYRGLHATTNISNGDTILSVPISLSVTSLKLEVTDMGKLLLEKEVFKGKWISYIFPLIYMLDELQNPHSEYKKWLDIIPKRATSHPMFFTEEERKWLKGSSTLEILNIDKGQVQLFYNKIQAHIPLFCKRHSFEEFLHYYYLLCSRFFGLHAYDAKRALLVPYADLVNTSNYVKRNATWEYDNNTMNFKIVALNKINKNDPVFLFINLFV